MRDRPSKQSSPAAALRSVLRDDLKSFVRKAFSTLAPGQTFISSWSIDALAYHLERVRRGEIRRLIINLPPRSLESITASVAFPAFVLGHDPTRRIICVSYSNELAVKLSNDFRAVIRSPWYGEVFPAVRVGAFKDSEAEVELTTRGSRIATSVGGTLTGRGGDLVIIDDPLKPADASSESKRHFVNQWFSNTLLSRLDDKRTGAVVIVMQRLNMDDLVGHVTRGSQEWTVLSLPAIAEADADIPIGPGRVYKRSHGDILEPVRQPLSVLDEIKASMGSDVFSVQYQQAPVPPGGAMIKKAWIKRYAALPTDMTSTIILQSWDAASKGGPDNDWSVCTTWQLGDQYYYLIDVYRDRIDYPTLKGKVAALAEAHGADQVLVEEAGTAIGLLAELAYDVRGLTAIRPERDKQTRMSIASAKIEAGQVFFPEHASRLPDFEAELFSFPGSSHDDQVRRGKPGAQSRDHGLVLRAVGRQSARLGSTSSWARPVGLVCEARGLPLQRVREPCLQTKRTRLARFGQPSWPAIGRVDNSKPSRPQRLA